MSPLLKDFLNDYAAKIVFRANAHGAMDALEDNLYPFVSQLQSTGKYAIDHKEMTVDHLNVLNNLYGFKKFHPYLSIQITWLVRKVQERI